MNWTTPAFEDLKMDSEIGSYQEDRPDEAPWPPVAEKLADKRATTGGAT
jgi:hypothetical protein